MSTYKMKSSIEAIKFTGDNYSECFEFIGDKVETSRNFMDRILRIHFKNRTVIVNDGQYITKDNNGEFYIADADMFELLYEEVK